MVGGARIHNWPTLILSFRLLPEAFIRTQKFGAGITIRATPQKSVFNLWLKNLNEQDIRKFARA
jgi:hypothetical protein